MSDAALAPARAPSRWRAGRCTPCSTGWSRPATWSQRWETAERGAARKYYRLTPEGTAELERLVAEWRAFTRAMDRVLDPEPAAR